MLGTRFPFSISTAAILTLVAGAVVTVALFAAVRSLEYEAQAVDFSQRANDRLRIVKDGLNDAVEGVETINQLFKSIDVVSREQFHVFSQPLLKRYPYIRALNFHRYVKDADLPAYVAMMREQYPDFAVTEQENGQSIPVRPKPMHIIVDYLEPMQGNEPAFGLDVSPHKHLLEVMNQATDSGNPASTKLLKLAQGSGSRLGFEVLKPVYRFGAVLDDVQARRQALIGDTAAIFSVDELFNSMFGAEGLLDDPEIALRIYVSESLIEEDLAYRSAATVASVPPSLLGWLYSNPLEDISSTFAVAGRPWRMIVSAAMPPTVNRHRGSLLTLVGGLLFSLLAAAYMQTLASRSQRIKRLVDERTQEARRANQMLSEDITARKRAEKALQLRERAIEASPNAIIITSAQPPNYPIEYVNPAFERITGYSYEEILGCSMRILNGNDRQQPGIAEFKAATLEQREGHAIVRSYKKDGTMFWNDLYTAPVRDADGVVTHFVAAQYDVTAMKRYEAELEFQTNQDTLTGLANRNLLRDRMNQAIAYADRYGHTVWAVFVDLDRFKFVNDTLGHKAGDALLQAVAERLQAAVRETDTVARIGGDEFVLVLPERTDETLAMRVIQRIMESIAKPFSIEEHEFFVTCSVGIAVYPSDGEDAETLMKHADIAMYRAKEIGRNNSQFYTPVMNERALERLRIEGDLRSALEQNQFELHYQPQLDLRTGQIIGMEALIRWNHPIFGMVAPIRFIGLAEETGLIVPIGAWVIRQACMQNKAWQDAGHGALRVAVNLSARQFAQRDLVETIAVALQDSGLKPQYLEVELTESMVMADVERTIAILRDLHALGVQISIDDFGTGYSSLAYLKRFPIDVLKIDQSFVRDITVDMDDATIVASIISLAHSLRLQVVAEGVETVEQLDYLRRHDCDVMQGYYFSKPVAAEAFGRMLEKKTSLL